MKLKKILITGGCGFLGSNLAFNLLDRKKNNEIHIIDNLSRVGSDSNLLWLKKNGAFKFHKISILNKKYIEDLVKKLKPDLVFHFAGQVAMSSSIENPFDDFRINSYGSLILLESIRKYSPNTISIYSSTNKVYGNLNQIKFINNKKRYIPKDYPMGFNEDIKLSFESPYGCSKGSADQYFLDFSRIYGLKNIVLRHSSIFGNRQFATINQGWVGWFVSQALKIKQNSLKKINICADGMQVRDILFSDDLISCYLKVYENIDKCAGEAFNIGGGINNSLSLLELFDMLEEKLNIKIHVKKNNWRESDQKFFVSDNKKIQKLTSWFPVIDLDNGINKMISWIESIEK